MKLFCFSILLIVTIALNGCKKTDSNTFVLKGRLLESSSNPTPKKHYKLNLYQRAYRGGFTGSSDGLDITFETDANGYFNITYLPGLSRSALGTGISSDLLSLYNVDSTGYSGYDFCLFNIKPATNIDFGNIYIHKKISVLKRYLQFQLIKHTTDTVLVTSYTAPILPNYYFFSDTAAYSTTYLIDSIKDAKVYIYDFDLKKYQLNISASNKIFGSHYVTEYFDEGDIAEGYIAIGAN